MFQFTGLPSVPYVFRYGYRRITSGEFPHSEIPGSQNGQLLPRAYRSRPRPSSALSAKASTVCSCSLDRKEHVSPLWSFQGAAGPMGTPCAHAPPLRQQSASPSKLNSVDVEVDVVLGETGHRTIRWHLSQ